MSCNCCNAQINSGRVIKIDVNGAIFKSCPNCSRTHGSMHVFHRHPREFGQTPARVTAKNPDGNQSFCIDCRKLDRGLPSTTVSKGRICNSL